MRLCACSASCDLWNGSAPLLPLFFDDFRSEKKICFDVAKQKGSDFTKICIKTRFFLGVPGKDLFIDRRGVGFVQCRFRPEALEKKRQKCWTMLFCFLFLLGSF